MWHLLQDPFLSIHVAYLFNMIITITIARSQQLQYHYDYNAIDNSLKSGGTYTALDWGLLNFFLWLPKPTCIHTLKFTHFNTPLRHIFRHTHSLHI